MRRPDTFCSRWLICSRRLRMSITAWLASVTLSRTRSDSLNCSSRSASLMPSATRRGSIAMLKSRDLVSPLAVMRTVYLPVGARAALWLRRPHDHAGEHDRAS